MGTVELTVVMHLTHVSDVVRLASSAASACSAVAPVLAASDDVSWMINAQRAKNQRNFARYSSETHDVKYDP